MNMIIELILLEFIYSSQGYDRKPFGGAFNLLYLLIYFSFSLFTFHAETKQYWTWLSLSKHVLLYNITDGHVFVDWLLDF